MSAEKGRPNPPHLWAKKGAARPAGLTGRWPQPVVDAEDGETEGSDTPVPSAEPQSDAAANEGQADELPPAASLITARRWWTDRPEMETVSRPAFSEAPAQVETEAAEGDERRTPEGPSESDAAGAPADEPAAPQPAAAETAETAYSRVPSMPPWLSAAVVAGVLVTAAAGAAGWYWLRGGPPAAVDQAEQAAASSVEATQDAAPEAAAVEHEAPPKPPETSAPEAGPEAPVASKEPPSASPVAEDAAPDGIAGRVPPPAPESRPAAGIDAPAGPAVATTAAPPEKPAYTVQLASVREAAAVEPEWARLQAVLPDVLAGLDYRVDTATLDEVGEVFRLRIGSFSGFSEARALCERIRARGQSCLVVPR